MEYSIRQLLVGRNSTTSSNTWMRVANAHGIESDPSYAFGGS